MRVINHDQMNHSIYIDQSQGCEHLQSCRLTNVAFQQPVHRQLFSPLLFATLTYDIKTWAMPIMNLIEPEANSACPVKWTVCLLFADSVWSNGHSAHSQNILLGKPPKRNIPFHRLKWVDNVFTTNRSTILKPNCWSCFYAVLYCFEFSEKQIELASFLLVTFHLDLHWTVELTVESWDQPPTNHRNLNIIDES